MIRVAIQMLMNSKGKFLGVLGGILFTSLLITHFQAIFAGIMTRTFAQISDIPAANIWVMDPAVEYVDEVASLPAPSLDRVKSVPGVEWAVPLYTGSLRARLPGGRFRSVSVVGVDDATMIGLPPSLTAEQQKLLREPDAVLVDEVSTHTLLRPGDVGDEGWGTAARGRLGAPTRPLAKGDELTVNDRVVRVVGLTPTLPRFMSKGILFTTYSRARQLAPPERNLMSYVLAHSTSGEDPASVARRIEHSTGLRARTSAEFSADTVWYYIKNTDIVGQVGIMVTIAIVVGSAITGMLLVMFTLENIRYYATLKALGASNRLVLGMVASQAGACGLMGFGLGMGASITLGFIMKSADLPFRLMAPSFIVTGAIVLVVCVVSAALSARHVLKLEPGVVFK